MLQLPINNSSFRGSHSSLRGNHSSRRWNYSSHRGIHSSLREIQSSLRETHSSLHGIHPSLRGIHSSRRGIYFLHHNLISSLRGILLLPIFLSSSPTFFLFSPSSPWVKPNAETRALLSVSGNAPETSTMKEAEDEMFRRDTQDKNPYHLREDMITYITSPNQADRTAASILHYLKEDNHEYNYVGFDVEGTSDPKTRQKTPPETLQLYTVAGDNKRATIYQMKKIAPRKSLPRDLEELLRKNSWTSSPNSAIGAISPSRTSSKCQCWKLISPFSQSSSLSTTSTLRISTLWFGRLLIAWNWTWHLQ